MASAKKGRPGRRPKAPKEPQYKGDVVIVQELVAAIQEYYNSQDPTIAESNIKRAMTLLRETEMVELLALVLPFVQGGNPDDLPRICDTVLTFIGLNPTHPEVKS
jgi:hypothetical protein